MFAIQFDLNPNMEKASVKK